MMSVYIVELIHLEIVAPSFFIVFVYIFFLTFRFVIDIRLMENCR